MSAVTTGSEKLRPVLASLSKACTIALDTLRSAPSRLWWLVVVVLALFCALALVSLVALFRADDPLPKVVFPPAAQVAGQQRLILYPRADSSPNAGALTESSVDADLLGVISMGDQSRANMRVKGKKETVFAVGDELVAGVVIDSISPAYVVVRERGALRKITLKSLLVGNNSAVIEASSAVEAVASDARPLPVEVPVAVSAVLTETGQSGLRIDSVDAAIAELAAIRVGDIIVAVEEITLSSLMADSAMLEALSRQQSLAVTLVRDGEQITLNMDGDGIRTLIAQ
ncbi:MAG: type II secretion system protein N [Porticoccaceae bacterium]